MNKRERQATISEIVEQHEVSSQEELRKLLLKRGWDVTQSTLSRDLREQRLARIPGSDGVGRYAIPDMQEDSRAPVLDRLLPQLFVNVDGVSELMVLHTLPGGAQAIAEAIDNEEWPEILGTIAGDDTILMICRSSKGRQRLESRLRKLAGAGSD
jgi:transcriptional regulator of arginine metabolism